MALRVSLLRLDRDRGRALAHGRPVLSGVRRAYWGRSRASSTRCGIGAPPRCDAAAVGLGNGNGNCVTSSTPMWRTVTGTGAVRWSPSWQTWTRSGRWCWPRGWPRRNFVICSRWPAPEPTGTASPIGCTGSTASALRVVSPSRASGRHRADLVATDPGVHPYRDHQRRQRGHQPGRQARRLHAYGFRNPVNQRLRTRCATTRRGRGCLNPAQLRRALDRRSDGFRARWRWSVRR